MLSSDAVIATFSYWRTTAPLISRLAEADIEELETVGHPFGGRRLLPSTRVDGEPTISRARGMSRKIADGMDLTLECISRYLAGDAATPPGATLTR